MIAAALRAVDNLLGRGEAAITVPPLDGALRPNSLLDDAAKRYPLENVDCLAVQSGSLLAAAGDRVLSLAAGGKWRTRFEAPAAITSIAAIGKDGLAVGLANGAILVKGGPYDGREYRLAQGGNCITAIAATTDTLYVANGSRTNAPDAWQRDLLERNASGSVWRIGLEDARPECIADGLAYPSGIAVDGETLVVSQAWRHALVRIGPGRGAATTVLLEDLPAYPGRLSQAGDGWWLALFAPRSQLVEFVLREPAYRQRMMAEVPASCWVAPRLRSGQSFYEPLQGGGVKHLGIVKPWAPAMSAGLCLRLDAAFHPVASLQSRADGGTHGVTGVVEADGTAYAAARGDGVVVALPSDAEGEIP